MEEDWSVLKVIPGWQCCSPPWKSWFHLTSISHWLKLPDCQEYITNAAAAFSAPSLDLTSLSNLHNHKAHPQHPPPSTVKGQRSLQQRLYFLSSTLSTLSTSSASLFFFANFVSWVCLFASCLSTSPLPHHLSRHQTQLSPPPPGSLLLTSTWLKFCPAPEGSKRQNIHIIKLYRVLLVHVLRIRHALPQYGVPQPTQTIHLAVWWKRSLLPPPRSACSSRSHTSLVETRL